MSDVLNSGPFALLCENQLPFGAEIIVERQ